MAALMTHQAERYFLYGIFATLLAFALVGCPSTQRAPESIEEGFYVTAVYGKALTESVNEAYITRSISKNQQMKALNILQDAKNGVQAGVAAYNLGDLSEAQTRLDAVEAGLRTVAMILAHIEDDSI